MIRDPSDGSVREKNEVIPDVKTIDSGLPLASTKPEHVERLERSRKQLENYRKTGLFQSTAEVAATECDHLTAERAEK